MRPSNPFLLALTLVGFAATGCGEGLLTPEEQAEYGDEVYGDDEQALRIAIGPGLGNNPGAAFEDDDGTPNEVPICPDCYVRVNTSGGYVSSVTPLLMTVRDRLPSGTVVNWDKIEFRNNGTLIGVFELNGFATSHWTSSQGSFFWASNVSTTALSLAQRTPSNWGNSITARVRLRYTTPDGAPHDGYVPIDVLRYTGGTWTRFE